MVAFVRIKALGMELLPRDRSMAYNLVLIFQIHRFCPKSGIIDPLSAILPILPHLEIIWIQVIEGVAVKVRILNYYEFIFR